MRPRCACIFRPKEGVGNAGCQRTRSRACSVVVARALVTTVAPKSPGIPARNGFNGFLRALPGDHVVLTPSPAEFIRELDADFGAPEPHDFAVRIRRVRQRTIRVHRIPSQRSRRWPTPLLVRTGWRRI